MNNVTIGGDDPRTGERFAYYETIAGGMGASRGADGLSGVHVHMTNTLNTPAEAIEYAYPLRVTRYELRRGSGGAGRWRGGDGVYREIELLADAAVTILSERRRHAPWGLAGGKPGAMGENWHLPCAQTFEVSQTSKVSLPGKTTFAARPATGSASPRRGAGDTAKTRHKRLRTGGLSGRMKLQVGRRPVRFPGVSELPDR